MGWLWITAAFLLFLLLIGSAHALDRYCAARYGYRPLALPNLAFMLIPHGVLLWLVSLNAPALGPASGIAAVPGAPLALVALGVGALVFMLVILTRSTQVWIALIALALMTIAASVLLFSMLFRELAESPRGPEP